MFKFRPLRADEIECRISQIKERDGKPLGLTLLLYKDARCDQNILDETVGPMNWQRKHLRDNANCVVSIWDEDKKMWVEKEDTGTESNTEKEKGLASDSFKRSCVNWGIGRELYSSPFIWIPAEACKIVKDSRGKWACGQRFTVVGIGYTNSVITGLKIKNQGTGKICFSWGEINDTAPEKPEDPGDDSEEQGNQNPEVKTDPVSDVEKTDKLPDSAKQPFDYRPIFARIKKRYKWTDRDFANYRKQLISAGVIEDIPGASLDEEGWLNLEEAIIANRGEGNGVPGET